MDDYRSYCKKHGSYDLKPDNSGCPYCKIAELEAEKNPPHILTLMQQVDELEARVEPLQPFKERIIELEAKRDQWRIAGEFWHKKNTALEGGLRELADEWEKSVGVGLCDMMTTYDTMKCVVELRALLDKESEDAN